MKTVGSRTGVQSEGRRAMCYLNSPIRPVQYNNKNNCCINFEIRYREKHTHKKQNKKQKNKRRTHAWLGTPKQRRSQKLSSIDMGSVIEVVIGGTTQVTLGEKKRQTKNHFFGHALDESSSSCVYRSAYASSSLSVESLSSSKSSYR